jgi:hypothetical protein
MSLNLYCWVDDKLSGLPIPPEEESIKLMTVDHQTHYTLTGDDIYFVWFEYLSWVINNNENSLDLKKALNRFFDAKDIEFRLL